MTKTKKPVTRETFRHEVDPNDPDEIAYRKQTENGIKLDTQKMREIMKQMGHIK